jgi:cholesterol transport system auxiliary component
MLVAALTGCISLGSREPQRYYVLEAPAEKTARSGTARASTLLIAPTTASSFYETQAIVYSRAPGERAYYQLHSWTERPARRITELLVARLERAGLFRSVAMSLSGIQGDLMLNTHLSEFYHEANSVPGSVRMSLSAELVDPVRRVALARRTFEQSAAADSYDAEGAVRAFNRAAGALLDDIAAWLDSSALR